MTTRTFKVTYEPDPEVDELLNEILAEMPEVVEVKPCVLITQHDENFFPMDYEVTSCCGIGPITNEKYCPECGAKIERQ